MPLNILGPFGAGVNPTTTRPTPATSGSGQDTWFRDCVDGDETTGTKVMSDWLNKMAAQLRRAIRGMGVTEAELDDDMLLKAIQRAEAVLANVGGAVEVYKGENGDGEHELYTLYAGAGITLTLDAENERIVVAASGGAATHVSIGTGVDVYAGVNGDGQHEYRSLAGAGGIDVAADEDGNITISGTSTPGTGDLIIRQRTLASTGSDSTANQTLVTAWSATVDSKGAGNTISVMARLRAGSVTTIDIPASNVLRIELDWRHSAGAWVNVDVALYNPTASGAGEQGSVVLMADITVPAGAPDVDLRIRHKNLDSNGFLTTAIYAGSKIEVIEYQAVA